VVVIADSHSETAMQGFDSAWAKASVIEGWLSRAQASVLYAAAAGVPPGCSIVEIGTWHGKSTVVLAKGKPPSTVLMTIDPYPNPPYGGGETAYRALLTNMRRSGVEGDVQLFQGTSEEGARAFDLVSQVLDDSATQAEREFQPTGSSRRSARIGLLFVDGAHDRSSVLADIDGWERFVVEGGLVCFHDAFFRLGVTLALLERHLMNTRFRYLGSVGSLAVFRRERWLGTAEALSSSVRLIGRFGYLGRNALVTVGVHSNFRPLLRLIPPEVDFEY
jgi:predicted O-methyltransferase YrrM